MADKTKTSSIDFEIISIDGLIQCEKCHQWTHSRHRLGEWVVCEPCYILANRQVWYAEGKQIGGSSPHS